MNIKSGISFYRIDNEQVFEKLGGSFLGDNTFESLMKLSTNYKTGIEGVIHGISGDNT